MTSVTYEQVVELVDQLPPHEQTQLVSHLLEMARARPLTSDEKMRLLRAVQIDVKVLCEPSIRREDWYNDDGR